MTAGVPVGTKFGRYEVVKHLARGGMADLSIARATGIENFERHVVIKHLRPEQEQDAAFVQMFVTEARLAGALHHHNIVQVYDIGQAVDRHFFAMEYVHGEDLRHLLSKLCERREHPPLEHVVTIAMAAAAALHHAHEQKGSDRKPLNIVHRDVTPANIIVAYDGNVKVVDFGIAKAAMRTADTAVGMLKGKVPYMAPEQCTGKPIDRRSDIFALGIVLYELATVRRLFKGGNEFFTMTAVVQGDIPKPTSHRKDIPQALEDIIMKALSRKPGDRYQTADEMRVALDQFAAKAGLRTSTSALADYMKKLFGEKPEPWMAGTELRTETPVDFDKTDIGAVPVPSSAIDQEISAPAQGSLLEQARRSTNAEAKDAVGKDKPQLPKVVPAAAKPPPSVPKKNADTEPVQIGVLPPVTDDTVKTAPAPSDDTLKTKPVSAVDVSEPAKDWMRVPHDPVLGKPPIVSGGTTERAKTDVDEKTDVSNPPPPPESRVSKVIVAQSAEREPTELVAPLPVGDSTDMTTPARVDRRWLFAGGIAVAALTVAIVIMVTGRSVDSRPTDKPANPSATAPVEPPTPVVEPSTAPAKEDTTGTTAYKPLKEDEPKPDEPEPDQAPDEPKADEPKPDDSIAATATEEPVKPDEIEVEPEPPVVDPLPPDPPTKQVAAKATPTKAIRRTPTKTTKTTTSKTTKTTKTTSKTTKTTKPTTWDPDALFLKKK